MSTEVNTNQQQSVFKHSKGVQMKNYKEKKILIGHLNCGGDNPMVDITDPGYGRDVWCRINNVPVLPGQYKCYAFIAEWDETTINEKIYHEKCVLSAEIIHEEFEKEFFEWKQFGTIGVDAGLAGFFISPKKDYSVNEWHALCNWIFDSTVLHNETGEENDECFLRDNGFFTKSGFGDGEYTVWQPAIDSLKTPALYIKFINMEDVHAD